MVIILFATLLFADGTTLIASTTKKDVKKEGQVIPADIQSLIRDARFFYYQLGNLYKADSLMEVAIRKAETSYDAYQILFCINAYFAMNELDYAGTNTGDYAKRAESLVLQIRDLKMEWQTWLHLSFVYQYQFEFDKAMTSCYKSLSNAEKAGDLELKARSYLRIGQLLQEQNQPLEGFRFLLNALTIAQSLKKEELLRQCFSSLSIFYSRNRIYEKAVEYRKKEIELLKKHQPIDSIALMWSWTYLEEINFDFLNRLNDDKIAEILRFSIRHRNAYLKQHVLAMYRMYLMNNEKFARLQKLYGEEYPEEMEYLALNNPSLHFRILAIFSELENRHDSALYYYQQAEKLLERSSNSVMLSNFYIRFGAYLHRNGKSSEAIDKYTKAFTLAEEDEYFDYALKAGNALIPLLKDQGNFKAALLYSEKNRSITDSLATMNRKDEMLSLEIRNEEQNREMSAKEEALATQRRNNIQYSLIVLMILGMFVILILVGSFRIHSGVIHFLSFFSFIFLFEFIILLADQYIHHATHGEPLKVIGIKIILIAILLPLHHYIEKKVTHYLVHRKLLVMERSTVRRFMARAYQTLKEIWAGHTSPPPSESPH
ncbi:MAG TPA: hypothetical protein P5228_06520 [Bacteroidales bacterium]|nr:hypothetical protein [Bacteroidales bacterium]HRZ49698.1 hypothetical protein [Bacteroidales bacterium]